MLSMKLNGDIVNEYISYGNEILFLFTNKELKIMSDFVQNQVEIDEVIEYIKQTFGVNRVMGLVMKGE